MQNSLMTNNGIPSGFPSLDELIGCWQNGDLIVVGARPQVGSAHLKHTLKDIRQTSVVEECADIVILLDRPSKEEIVERPGTEGDAEFIVAVNKHGNVGSVSMRFNTDGLSFVDPLTPVDSHFE